MRVLATMAAAVAVSWGATAAADDAPSEPFGAEWSITENQPCHVWNYGMDEELAPFIWSGGCVDGKASGEGRLTVAKGKYVYEGSMQAGKLHGRGILTYPSDSYEGEWHDGMRHGSGTMSSAEGDVMTCEWHEDEPVDGSCVDH